MATNSAHRNNALQCIDQGGKTARRGYHQGTQEKRGLKGKVGPREIKKIEDIISDGNIRHRALPWAELAAKAGLIRDKQVHFYTVRKVSIRGTSITADSLY